MLTVAMTKTLGRRIRELREENDLSLREFAKKLGSVTAAHISDIELGRRYPSDSLLKRIAAALRVPLAKLEEHDNRPPVEEIKRLSEADPTFGFAFRKLVDEMVEKNISADDILKFTNQKSDREKPR